MRVGLVSTVNAPVSSRAGGAGSVEALVWTLANALTDLGHAVLVFGTACSSLQGGELIATLPGPYAKGGSPGDWFLCEWMNLCNAVAHSKDVDILHSHA